MEDVAPPLDPAARCVCDHIVSLHQLVTNVCLGLDQENRPCPCAEFQVFEDMPPLERVRIIRGQVETLGAMLQQAQIRGLLPEEEAAFAELADAFAELSAAWRSVFRE